MHKQPKRWTYVKLICISPVDTATIEGYGGIKPDGNGWCPEDDG
jgi:hypothetical protein